MKTVLIVLATMGGVALLSIGGVWFLAWVGERMFRTTSIRGK